MVLSSSPLSWLLRPQTRPPVLALLNRHTILEPPVVSRQVWCPSIESFYCSSRFSRPLVVKSPVQGRRWPPPSEDQRACFCAETVPAPIVTHGVPHVLSCYRFVVAWVAAHHAATAIPNNKLTTIKLPNTDERVYACRGCICLTSGLCQHGFVRRFLMSWFLAGIEPPPLCISIKCRVHYNICRGSI